VSAALVIFDCDGVLIDSEMITCRVQAERLTAHGLRITTEDVVRRFTGMRDREMYAILEREHGRALPDDYDAGTKELIAAAYRSELRALPGVAAALDAIRLPVCVASSSNPTKLRFGLELTGLYPRFAPHLFSAAQVGRGKPAPDLFLFAAAQMGRAPDDCLVIEDSVAGVQAARAAGMAVFGFCGGGHCRDGHGDLLRAEGAALAFERMEALPSLIDAWERSAP
jgi:HAD superfamily hydrolase (TIGR01509 family)